MNKDEAKAAMRKAIAANGGSNRLPAEMRTLDQAMQLKSEGTRFVVLRPAAVLQVSPDCPMTGEARLSMNAWLLDMFGVRHRVIDGQILYAPALNTAFVNLATMDYLRRHLKAF